MKRSAENMSTIEADAKTQSPSEQDSHNAFERAVAATEQYQDAPRWDGIPRLFSARQVVEQRGTIPSDYIVAREAAEAFYPRLRELFAQRKSITTFGPYSPGQAVSMKRMGIEGIYLGGWATSAKGSTTEDPGPDLASYPLSQVPDDAAVLVRALLTADRHQPYQPLHMTQPQLACLAPARPLFTYKACRMPTAPRFSALAARESGGPVGCGPAEVVLALANECLEPEGKHAVISDAVNVWRGDSQQSIDALL